MADPIAVYVHTPFCPTKCGYCDFNSYAMSGDIMREVTEATLEELKRSPVAGAPAKTIFIGGGTPTYLTGDLLVRLLQGVMAVHPPEEGCEITSESNPGTADADKYAAMVEAGFNRISLGAQSFAPDDLVRLGRVHSVGEIERAVDVARKAGFKNLNLDLMFALPGQSLRAWSQNLDRALALQPDHLSLYCLTLEPNTPFYKEHLRGSLIQPDEEIQVALYQLACDRTLEAGFDQYEISNFAKPGQECRHNLAYWHNEFYAAYGPGAVGFLPFPEGPVRFTNVKHPTRYVEAISQGGTLWCEHEVVDDRARTLERIMLGLRLNEGVDLGELVASEEIDEMEALGWLRHEGPRVRLTKEGRHFCSEVALRLWDASS